MLHVAPQSRDGRSRPRSSGTRPHSVSPRRGHAWLLPQRGRHPVHEREHLPVPMLLILDRCACLRIGQGSGGNPVHEQVVEKVLKLAGEVARRAAGIEPADPVEHSPDGDGSKAEVASAIEASKTEMRGSGRRRLISETTSVSIGHADQAVIPPLRDSMTTVGSQDGLKAEAQRHASRRNAVRRLRRA